MDSCVPIAIAIVQRGDHVLIGQRPPGVALAGYWEFPGGKIEPNESVECAAQRECLEETGMEVRVVRQLSVEQFSYDHATVRLHFLICCPLSDTALVQSPFRWVSRSELSNFEFPPANAKVVASLARTV